MVFIGVGRGGLALLPQRGNRGRVLWRPRYRADVGKVRVVQRAIPRGHTKQLVPVLRQDQVRLYGLVGGLVGKLRCGHRRAGADYLESPVDDVHIVGH